MPSERIVEMEKRVVEMEELIMRMEKRTKYLAVFFVVLCIVAFSLVVSTSQYLWDENRFLFLGVVISVPSAFFLKRQLDSMEKELEHLKTLDPEDYYKPPVMWSHFSVDELLKMKDQYKSNKRVVFMINGVIEKREKAKGNSKAD